EFMERLKTQPHRGRLAFIVDATQSREATWDLAIKLQTEMFEAAVALGTLQLQLTFLRGTGSAAECKHTPWISDGRELVRRMSKVACRGGFTQIQRGLRHGTAGDPQRAISARGAIGDQDEGGAGRVHRR